MPDPGPLAQTPAVLLGVDVGGSHSAAVLARGGGTILGRVDGPGAALRPGQAAASASVVAQLVGRAARQAGVNLPADRAVVGAAGAGRALEQRELRSALAAYGLARRLEVTTDGEIALVAAFGTAPGILVSAGTGSIAYARDRNGQLHRAGGYGWQLGDEGGGYWIGRQALGVAARAHDRHEDDALAGRLVSALGLDDFNSLVRWAAVATPPQIARLARHVLDAARGGEPAAREIVAAAAARLGDLARNLVRDFSSGMPIPIAVSGALLGRESPLREAVREVLRQGDPRLRWSDVLVDGPIGAIRLAAELP